MRVTTRLTTDLPGEFFFQLVGDITSGIKQPAVVEELILFPNPASNRVTTSFKLAESSEATITVLNLLGEAVFSFRKGAVKN
ncbi:MAG: hypothetical protein J5I98_15330 [Phaeodactylibacter sp.]|nr:hypothetical protein [Phaeodactylibacter sp.]